MYDSTATLIGESATRTYDKYGNEKMSRSETTVFVQPRGVYSSEYYNAAQAGHRPSLSLYIANREDYSGEKRLTFEGKIFTVLRVDWSAQRDGITLVCEEEVGAYEVIK